MSLPLQLELDRLLETISRRGEPPSLLLHACCAPCSSYVLEYLSDYFSVTLCFYNPNIAPGEEYAKRLGELSSLLRQMKTRYPVELPEQPYDPERFYEAAAGLRDEPEGGSRCEACFRLRLEHAAKAAAERGCGFFTTTLSVSPHKNAALLDRIALEYAQQYKIPRLPSDFKKRGGYQRSVALSRAYGLYRQDYCGCVYSK